MKIRQKKYGFIPAAGFTLTEIALVLGVIGLLLGAIWEAAAHVYDVLKTNKAVSEVSTIIQNARTLYANSEGFDNGVLTTPFVNAKLFPSDTVNNGIPSNPWNTTSTISSTPGAGIDVGSQQGWGGCPASPTSLQIVFWGLHQQQTVSLLTQYIGSSHADVNCIYADCLGTFTNPSGMTINQLLNACSSATNMVTNVVISVDK